MLDVLVDGRFEEDKKKYYIVVQRFGKSAFDRCEEIFRARTSGGMETGNKKRPLRRKSLDL